MSASEPTPSPIPRPSSLESQQPSSQAKNEDVDVSRPHPKFSYPTCKLRLQINDLSHEGSAIFLANCNAATAFASAVNSVLSILYHPTETNSHIPGTRSVTVILEPMGGVAGTRGIELDRDHKQIHFSLDYIKNHVAKNRQSDEIQGVLVHEMVHCWQWNAKSTCPGGLIEGIADYVRLKAGLGPPHWKRPMKKAAKAGEEESKVNDRDQKWDAGYEKTGFFLEWLGQEYGDEMIIKMNGALRDKVYDEKEFWTDLFHETIEDLWNRYVKTWKEEDGEAK